MRHNIRNPAERLRWTVERLPRRTREAMLRGIETNRIIVGAYVDRDSGGICPMLAAHRNGGRTSVGSFARAWDAYTGAKRPRRATRREVNYLRSLLETSLGQESLADTTSIAELASQIRAERAEIRARQRGDTGDGRRGGELRSRAGWAWLRPSRGFDEYKDLLAAAEEQLSERRAAELIGDRPAERLR